MLRLFYINSLQTVPSTSCSPSNLIYGLWEISNLQESAISLLLQHLLLPSSSQYLDGFKPQSCALPCMETCLMGTDKRQILFWVGLTLLRKTAWVSGLKASDTVASEETSHNWAGQRSGGQWLMRNWCLVHLIPLQHFSNIRIQTSKAMHTSCALYFVKWKPQTTLLSYISLGFYDRSAKNKL